MADIGPHGGRVRAGGSGDSDYGGSGVFDQLAGQRTVDNMPLFGRYLGEESLAELKAKVAAVNEGLYTPEQMFPAGSENAQRLERYFGQPMPPSVEVTGPDTYGPSGELIPGDVTTRSGLGLNSEKWSKNYVFGQLNKGLMPSEQLIGAVNIAKSPTAQAALMPGTKKVIMAMQWSQKASPILARERASLRLAYPEANADTINRQAAWNVADSNPEYRAKVEAEIARPTEEELGERRYTLDQANKREQEAQRQVNRLATVDARAGHVKAMRDQELALRKEKQSNDRDAKLIDLSIRKMNASANLINHVTIALEKAGHDPAEALRIAQHIEAKGSIAGLELPEWELKNLRDHLKRSNELVDSRIANYQGMTDVRYADQTRKENKDVAHLQVQITKMHENAQRGDPVSKENLRYIASLQRQRAIELRPGGNPDIAAEYGRKIVEAYGGVLKDLSVLDRILGSEPAVTIPSQGQSKVYTPSMPPGSLTEGGARLPGAMQGLEDLAAQQAEDVRRAQENRDRMLRGEQPLPPGPARPGPTVPGTRPTPPGIRPTQPRAAPIQRPTQPGPTSESVKRQFGIPQ
jgi:hypothetical protein